MEEFLSKVGLSPKAAKTYIACLQLGPATMTDIARATGLKRPTTYLVVDELLVRGFLSSTKKGKRMYYAPEHPRRFVQILRNREKGMERLLPELEALYEGPKDKPRIRVFEGKEAMMQIYEDVFRWLAERGGELLFFTAIGDLQYNFPEALERFRKLLREGHGKYRVRELNVDDAAGRAYVASIRSFKGPHHRIRVFRKNQQVFFDTDNLIFEDKLMMVSIKKDIFVVVIEHQQIADTYRALFNAAWETGVEIS